MKIAVIFLAFILTVCTTSAHGSPPNKLVVTEDDLPRSSRVIRQSTQCKGIITVARTEKRWKPSTNSNIRGTLTKNNEVTIYELKNGDDNRLWFKVETYDAYVEAAYIRITQENGKNWCKIPQVQSYPTPTPKPAGQRGPVRRFLSYVFS